MEQPKKATRLVVNIVHNKIHYYFKTLNVAVLQSPLLLKSKMNDFEVGTLIASLSIMILYHAYLYRRIFFFHSNKVQLSLNIQIAERWIMKHKEKADAPSVTLAIQTLRNSILVAVFMGGGVLNLAVSTANEFNDYDNKDGRMKARTCVLAACCICSFLCWVNVIRYCAHLGYLVGAFNYTPPKKAETTPNPPTTAADPNAVVDPTNVQVHTDSDKEKKIRFVEDEEKQYRYAILLARYLLTSFR